MDSSTVRSDDLTNLISSKNIDQTHQHTGRRNVFPGLVKVYCLFIFDLALTVV
jgi:hypothetical protein